MNNNFGMQFVCRMNHDIQPTEEQIANPTFGSAQINLQLDGYVNMTVFFNCYKCRPELKPVKVRRKRKITAQ